MVYLPLADGPRSCDRQTRADTGLPASAAVVGPSSVWLLATVVFHGQLTYTWTGYALLLLGSWARSSWQVDAWPQLTGRMTTSQLLTPSPIST